MESIDAHEAGIINWSSFQGSQGGFAFEEMCFELLKKLEAQFLYEWDETKGRDGGRDILIFSTNSETGLKEPVCVVECKSRVGKNASVLKIDDISKIFLFAQTCEINKVLILTNTNYHADVINTFMRLNQTKGSSKVLPLNKFELELILSKLDALIELSDGSLFPRDHIQQQDIKEYPDVNKLLSDFLNKNNPTVSLIKTVRRIEKNNRSLNVAYVDPERNLERLISKTKSYKAICVLGAAGLGKSRLLLEYSKSISRCIQIDLSASDYLTDLKSQILSKIFDLNSETLERLPTSVLVNLLLELNINEQLAHDISNAITAGADYPDVNWHRYGSISLAA